MTIEEELFHLREENKGLRRQLAQREEFIQKQQGLLAQQHALIQQVHEHQSTRAAWLSK